MTLIFVFGVLMVSICYSGYAGSAFALWNEQFDTKVRMSGVAVGTQFGFALGGFAPAIAATLAGPKLDNWVPVAGSPASTADIAVIAVRQCARPRTPLVRPRQTKPRTDTHQRLSEPKLRP